MIILPAIDLRQGRCVNLIQGHAHKETIFSEYPIDIAKQWEQQGAEYLHLVDLDGAKTGNPLNDQSIKAITNELNIVHSSIFV